MNSDSTATTARWGARVAVLALRSQADLPPSPNETAYSLMPSGESLRIDHIVESLARMPKPLSCRATVRDGRLILDCNAVDDPQFADHLRMVGERQAHDWAAVVRQLCEGESDPLILVGSSKEAAIVPSSGVEAFMRDYHLGHSLSLKPIQPSLLPEGVCAVLAIGPPDKVEVRLKLGDSPPAGRRSGA